MRQREFYLTHMGRIWVAMIALFVLGVVLWAISGPLGFVVCVVGMGLARSRWDRSYRGYLASMFRSGREPFRIRHWTLIGDSLVHVVDPSRPPRCRG